MAVAFPGPLSEKKNKNIIQYQQIFKKRKVVVLLCLLTMSPKSNESSSSHLHTEFTQEDLDKLKSLYDRNHDGTLTRDEIMKMVHEYNLDRIKDPEILRILKRYDRDGNGHIDMKEIMHLENSVLDLQDSQLRYTAYTVSLGRIFRYLAFTSDFGEALRPVVHARIVTGTYAIAFAYCIADVGYEAYKLKENDYYHEHTKEKMTMTQCVVERATFQAFASLILPAIIIHKTVDVSKAAFHRLGRFTKWGPSIVGLSMIPFLPVYLDAPVEEGLEYFFHHYGPWAKKDKSH